MMLFDHGAAAVGETDLADGSVELRAGFANKADATEAIAAITSRLPAVECESFIDETQNDWLQTQQLGLSPTKIGSWTVQAPWHPAIPNPETTIIIDPGGAFGHGAHPSTSLVGELLLRSATPDSSVVDLGTGTGVLAVLAAKTGATVRAVEVDPHAIAVAAQNVAANHVADAIELRHADATTATLSASDLVVANVTLDVHLQIASNYAIANEILVAGILCRQVRTLAARLFEHDATTISTKGEWAAIHFRRRNLDSSNLTTPSEAGFSGRSKQQ